MVWISNYIHIKLEHVSNKPFPNFYVYLINPSLKLRYG